MIAVRIIATAAVASLIIACQSSPTPENELIDNLFVGSNPPRDENDVRIPEYDAYLRENGIDENYSAESEARLTSSVEAWLERLATRLSEIDAAKERGEETAELKDEKKDIKKRQFFLEHGLEMLQGAQTEGATESARISAFHLGKRITYVVASMQSDDEPSDLHERLRRKYQTVETYTKVLERHALKDIQFKIPYLEKSELSKPIGDQKAALEARFLVDPAAPEHYVSSRQLAGMDTREIATLDVSERHPAWHTETYSAEHSDTWTQLEAWVQKRITKKLNKDQGIKDDFPDFSYRLAVARRVLVFDKLKEKASSAKIKGEDAFGINWKIKWGDEVQTEPVGNRLWMKLGGKYTDLVYVNGLGKDHLVLVLSDPAKANEQTDDTCYPVTYEDLATCLIESSYEFNLNPYRHETGELTPDNIDQILANHPPEAVKGYRKTDLIGRHYVTFRESLVEIDPPNSIVRRGGATSFSGIGARQDRVARALFVFNMWIWNQDAKDDNNRGLLLKNYTQDDYAYYEAQHDFGLSLGGILAYGKINEMAVENDFARIGKKPSPQIFFRQHVFYYPKAWLDTTFADGLWMARKLMTLTRADIEQIVAHTLWPDFMQEALSYKLLARRNHIARLFHLEVPAGDEFAAPNVDVSLATAEDRRDAAERYSLDPAWIEKAMLEAGLLDRGFRDRLVKAGQVSPCEETILIGILQRHLHPSGLTTRVKRFFDNKEGDRGCNYRG